MHLGKRALQVTSMTPTTPYEKPQKSSDFAKQNSLSPISIFFYTRRCRSPQTEPRPPNLSLIYVNMASPHSQLRCPKKEMPAAPTPSAAKSKAQSAGLAARGPTASEARICWEGGREGCHVGSGPRHAIVSVGSEQAILH